MNRSAASGRYSEDSVLADGGPATNALSPVAEVRFFEADGLVFGIRVADGTALITTGNRAAAQSAIQKRLAALPAQRCDLAQSAHAPSRNRSRLTLMIAQQCNLRCVYCYGNAGVYGNPGIMNRESSLRLVHNFFKRRGPQRRTINFFGGEPLLCFDLLRELTACAAQQAVHHHRHPVFTMTTNATLVTPAISAWLARHRFSVMVSIDGNAEMHGRNRPDAQGCNSWDAVVKGAKLLLRDLGPRAVTARATLTQNFPDVDDMVKGLEQIGFQSIALCAVEPVGHSYVSTLTEKDYRRLRTAVRTLVVPTRLRTGKGPSWDPLRSAIGLLKTGKRRQHACGVGNLSSAVSSDGNLYPCHRYVGDQRFIIGKNADGLVDETLPGFAAFEKFRRQAVQECNHCLAKTFCAGSCAHIAVERMDNGLLPHDPDICRFIRMGVCQALRVVASWRMPPKEGTAVLLGPEFMRRPYPVETLKTIFDHRLRSEQVAAWTENERSIIRAVHDRIVSRLGIIVPSLRKQAPRQYSHWLVYGLVRFLVGANVIDPLNETELRIVASGAAMTGLASVDNGNRKDCIRTVEEILESELLDLLTDLMKGRCIDKKPDLLLALPSLALARLHRDQALETALRSFVAMVIPLRGWMEDYARLFQCAQNRHSNPWYALMQEKFGQLFIDDAAALMRHPAAIDLVSAHITVEMRRATPQAPWHQPAVQAYTAWLIDRLGR